MPKCIYYLYSEDSPCDLLQNRKFWELGYLQKILDKLSGEIIFLEGAGYPQNFETRYWLSSENKQVKSYQSGYL